MEKFCKTALVHFNLLLVVTLTACSSFEKAPQEVDSAILQAAGPADAPENSSREPQSKQPRLSIQNTHNPQIAGPNDCVNAAYPDAQYTPGATFPNLTEKQLCTPGYTATVRNVTDKEARQVFVNYGIESKYLTKDRANYEVDHFISLELGGNNDVANLWPQPYEPKPGARQKDVVETSLHRRVCANELTLSQAQSIITGDWCAEYVNILNQEAK